MMGFRVIQIIFFLICSLGYSQEIPRLLVVIPTREHPDQLFQVLDQFYENLSGEVECHFLISCDSDDNMMNNKAIEHQLNDYPHLILVYDRRVSISESFQRDLSLVEGMYDILIAASDHHIPIQFGYDIIIAEKMRSHYANNEGVLNFQEHDSGKNINSVPVVGKRYYSIFGSLYYPDYQTLPCAQKELTMVSRMLAKETLIIQSLFKPLPLAESQSSLEVNYQENDEQLYKKRFNESFGLDDGFISQFLPKVWSILICTLDERVDVFSYIYDKLQNQIVANGLTDKIEVLHFRDNRQYSIGYKRNELMRQSQGMYVNFLDDDDDVHEDYIKMIYTALQTQPDCVSLLGIITFDGAWPCLFKHGIEYTSHYKENEIFYRPPNHISTIKRSIATRFPFLDISYGEDYDWSMQISRSQLLKMQAEITTPYYFYKYVTAPH